MTPHEIEAERSERLPHTSGPWQSMHLWDLEGTCTIIGGVDGDTASPSYTTVCILNDEPDEFRANRNLICAAPDMLAALKRIDGEATVKEPSGVATSTDAEDAFDEGYLRGLWVAAEMARKAIAQAEGK